jgi:hypothetical protein
MIKDTQKQNDVPTADSFDRYLMYVDNPALGVDAKTRHYEIERFLSTQVRMCPGEVVYGKEPRSPTAFRLDCEESVPSADIDHRFFSQVKLREHNVSFLRQQITRFQTWCNGATQIY